MFLLLSSWMRRDRSGRIAGATLYHHHHLAPICLYRISTWTAILQNYLKGDDYNCHLCQLQSLHLKCFSCINLPPSISHSYCYTFLYASVTSLFHCLSMSTTPIITTYCIFLVTSIFHHLSPTSIATSSMLQSYHFHCLSH